MWELNKYNKARLLIESRFKGLPHSHSSLIKSIISLADPSTGIVKDICWGELSLILVITPAPGRKNAGTPSKQTIRNYIKSIVRECGDYFKVISEGQSLQFLFPEIPKIFNKLVENREVNTEVDCSTNHENTEENIVFYCEVNTELNIEVNTPQHAVKKLFININNNNNNNTAEKLMGTKTTKQPIAADFHPTPETLSRAIASGYHFAAEAHIIQEFIDKNTAWGSAYADFNPIYLCFLAQYAHFQQAKQMEPNGTIRSITHERTPHKNNSYDAAMERVRLDNADAIEPSTSTNDLFQAPQIIGGAIEHATPFVALGGIDQAVWPTVSYQERL